jgi:hypothetical protein
VAVAVAPLDPYWNQTVIDSPLGFTVPFMVPVLLVRWEAARVVTVGALAAPGKSFNSQFRDIVEPLPATDHSRQTPEGQGSSREAPWTPSSGLQSPCRLEITEPRSAFNPEMLRDAETFFRTDKTAFHKWI